MVQMVGEHAVKHTSNLQGATWLNVSECEHWALTHGAAHGLGLKAYMADLGFETSLPVTVRRQKLSHHAEDWDVSDMYKHATCGFRRESLQHISQYRRSELRRTQRISSQRQQAERQWDGIEKCLDSDMSKLTAARRNSDRRVWIERRQFGSNQQQFIFAENQLEDERTLSNYNSRVSNLHDRGSMLLCKGRNKPTFFF